MTLDNHNPFFYIAVGLGMMLCILAATAGCREKSPPETSVAASSVRETPATKEAKSTREGMPEKVEPFLDLAKDTLSAGAAKYVDRLSLSGFALLVIVLGVGFVTGSWRTAGIAFVFGLLLSVSAVLLAQYPRVALLVPAYGICVLALVTVRKVFEWWTGYRAWRLSATAIETSDLGAKSLGKKAKQLLAEFDPTGLLDKALAPLKKEWEERT